MNAIRASLFAVLNASFGCGLSSFVFAQGGSLTPPGAPAPTMKTLDQVEARTPISSAPFTISSSGSYYLTGNLAVSTGNAINISTDGVTLDLNGFTISSTANPASGTAVVLNGVKNATVQNGHIRGTTTFSAGVFTAGGFAFGIRNTTIAGFNLHVANVTVHGLGSDGIDLMGTDDPTNLVERCGISVCGGSGIRAAIICDCGAKTTGANAISGEIVTNSFGQTVNTAVSTAFGILATSMAENCRGIADTGTGLSAVNASNCRGTSNSGVGLTGANAINCEGISTTGAAGINLINGTASFCRGQRAGGVAINAFNAIGCTSNSGTVNATNKSLGTP